MSRKIGKSNLDDMRDKLKVISIKLNIAYRNKNKKMVRI